jgi:hypothetical protein
MSVITPPGTSSRARRLARVTGHRFRSGRLALVLAAAPLLVGTAVGGLLFPAPANGATAAAVIQVQPGSGAPGSTVVVNGTNFPPSTDVQVQICGNQALDGSGDCDLTTSQEVSTTPRGLFQLQLDVTVPPKPCPCVVMALDFSLSITPTTPFDVIGAPEVAPSTSKLHSLQLVSAALQGDGPWTSWFGAPPQRELIVTVHNPNPTPYVFPPLVLSVGQSKDTTTREATTQRLATIPPLKTATYEIPVTFPAVSIGEHQVIGVLGNPGFSTHFEVQTWLFPWGLAVVLLIVLEIIALLITRGFRERRRRKEALAAAAVTEVPVPVEVPVG